MYEWIAFHFQYVDDLLVWDKDLEECERNTQTVLERHLGCSD